MLFHILKIKLIANRLAWGRCLKVGGGVKEYMSVEQGAKVSTATQRAETTTMVTY